MIMTKKPAIQVSKEQVAQALFIHGDEELLLNRVKEGDKVAMVQLVMLYMPNIISFAQTWLNSIDHDISKIELIDLATQVFIDTVEQKKDVKNDLYNELRENMKLSFRALRQTIFQKRRWHTDLHLPERIDYLNKLNRVLKVKEEQIVERAKTYLALVEKKIKGKDVFTTDYELELEVAYFGRNSNGEPMHRYWDCFRFESDEPVFGLLCDGENWQDPYMPNLEEPYCYLLHDLIDHSRIGRKLFGISQIWFDIHFIDQSCLKCRKIK